MYFHTHFNKTHLAVLMLTCLALPVHSGFRQHDGFFLSMNIGLNGGIILEEQQSFTDVDEFSYRGGGSTLDLKVGGCPSENLCLSGDVIRSQWLNPEVEENGEDQGRIEGLGASQNLLGIGVTHYLSPLNVFFSGTLGLSRFRYEDLQIGDTITSEPGPAFYFKAGKEWWVSSEWGLGVSGFLFLSNSRDKTEDFESNTNGASLGILFNTTFN